MQSYFFIDSDKRYVKISFNEIIYVEACRNYIRVVTARGAYMTLLSMRHMESMLPPDKFCRIHRSYIVCLDAIQSFVSDKVFVQDKILPIGESYNKALHQKVLIITNETYRNCSKVSNVLGSVINNPN